MTAGNETGELTRIGVDVGGTHTDAVILCGRRVVASFKAATTEDVGAGIIKAIEQVRIRARTTSSVQAVMIGTTHFTNAFVEAKNLCRVGVLRLGAPATLAIRPMLDWPERLKYVVHGHSEIIAGGFNYDGRPISRLDPAQVKRAAREFRARDIEAIAVTSVFAPVNPKEEKQVAAILRDEIPGVRVVESSQIGRIGLIERENSAIMNAALLPLAQRVVDSFGRALAELGLRTPFYISQNDGTLLEPDVVASYPVLTFASGPTNSMRGAAFLSGSGDTLVVDIGGTTTDVGAMTHGFPRESTIAADIGGIRTNFRMPDILSVGLGGGSHVEPDGERVRIGPRSVGYRITQDAHVFGGGRLTATDIAVAAGYANVGDPQRVADLDSKFVASAVDELHRMVEEAIDRMKPNAAPVPVVLVGGGSILINRELRGCSSIDVPESAGVANAVGAAIGQVSGTVDRIFQYETGGRDAAISEARDEAVNAAIKSGAHPPSVHVTELEELPLKYLPGGAVRIRVKVVGDLATRSAA